MFTLSFLYAIIILVLCVGAFFIVYHILRYSLNDTLSYFGALAFGGVFVLLVFINLLSFQALDAEDLLPTLEVGPLMQTNNLTLPATTQRNPW